MPEIQLGQKTISYTIRESAKAKRPSLRIDARRGLQVVLPVGIAIDDLDALLKQRERWILKYLEKYEKAPTPSQPRYRSGDQIPFMGEDHELEVIATQKGKQTLIARQGRFLRIRLRAGLDESGQTQEIRHALETWYRGQAKTYITKRATELAALHGFKFEKIAIKGQKTRWGSCSTNHNLNFNWRLMMAPPGGIDYVIIHELCHLREMNHSKRFWSLVRKYCPSYQKWIRWFKDHAPDLHL